MKKRYSIGIDAGTNTGVAVWDNRENALVDLLTLSFWETYHRIVARYTPDQAEIVIEWLGDGALYARSYAGTRAGRDRVASNVGSVRRETVLLAEGLERAGFTVDRRRLPSRAPKWTAEYLKRVTGYAGRSSAHARDALRIVFIGRPAVYSKTKGPKRPETR